MPKWRGSRYYLRYWHLYFLGVLLLLAVNLLAAYIPQLVKSAINAIESFSSNTQDASLLAKTIKHNVLLIVGSAILMAFIRAKSRHIIFGVGRQVEFDLKQDIFDHLVHMEPAFFQRKKTGDLISIITNDVQSFRALGGFAILNIFNTSIAFLVVVPLMWQANAVLTASFLSLIPILIIFVTILSNRIKYFQEFVQRKLGNISHFIEQNLSGIHIIKAYAQEEAEIARFEEQNNSLLSSYLSLVRARSLINPVMRVIASLGFILLLYLGGKSVISNNFSLGDFAAYALYIERLIWPIATLGWLITVVHRAQVSEKRIKEVMEISPGIKDKESAVDKRVFDSMISIRSSSTVYVDTQINKTNSKTSAELDFNTKPKDNYIEAVSIDDYKHIYKGEWVGIVGTIGSGKSVLAQKLMHLMELDNDEILIDGLDLKDYKLEALRSLINLVPQENFLFSTSIAENIAYAKDLSQAEIEKLAKAVNIHDEILRFPEAYQTVVGERGVTLSGGQRQRLAIARALALEPEVLILDDALSSVDDKVADHILKNLRELRQTKTTIFITHKLKILESFDRIFVMDNFRIVQEGTHQELLKQDLEQNVYRSLWNKDHIEVKSS